ncbi:MAG: hypothetical protein K2J81_09250 [Treponemataceae bacterium]|nr:hypothetical protein [Treponemataceae bacterium]
MMNAFKYFLTAISDIKQAEIPKGVGTQELERITNEFEAVVEAGPSLPYKPARVFIYGEPSEKLRHIVHMSFINKERFSLMLEPQPNRTFAVC